MAPKKQQKMALTDFLMDSSLGDWAAEMEMEEALPTAPAPRTDGERSRGFGGSGGRDDYPSRESQYPPREELPLPTAPPYTAFLGNLAFDVSEGDVEGFFACDLKSVKLIKDREGKPKGFGYIEFATLQDLKDGLAKSGVQMAGRTVRVSVAEPQKERSGFDDDKFASPWRRDGPLPSRDGDRFGGRGGGPQRFDSRGGPSRDPAEPTEAETNNDWRASNRGPLPGPDRPSPGIRKSSGFGTPEGGTHAADTEQTWSKGSKFTPSPQGDPSGPPRGSGFVRRDGPRTGEDEPSDWRAAPRRGPAPPPVGRAGSYDRSPTESVPTTPNMGRRKLELLPRTSSQSAATSPIGSPKAASTSNGPAAKSNPFGAAKPVDASARDREIEERLGRERESRLKEKSPQASPRMGNIEAAVVAPTPAEGGSWRDRRGPAPTPSSPRMTSATHSRRTSQDGTGATTPPSAGGVGKKYGGTFSFTAMASEIQVAEGEDDEEEAPQPATGEA